MLLHEYTFVRSFERNILYLLISKILLDIIILIYIIIILLLLLFIIIISTYLIFITFVFININYLRSCPFWQDLQECSRAKHWRIGR